MCRTATITWGENNPICRSFLITYTVSREFYSGFRGNELKILNPKTLLFITIFMVLVKYDKCNIIFMTFEPQGHKTIWIMNTNSNGLFMHGSRGLHPPPSENSKLSLNFQKIGIGKDLHPRQIIPRTLPPFRRWGGGGGLDVRMA